MRIIALEGPSHAGKSTLLSAIGKVLQRTDVVYLPDYVDAAGGPLDVPSTPGTSVDEIQGLLFFLQVEVKRLGAIQRQQETVPTACFLDRSIHTLLAHRYSVELMKGIECFHLASRIISELTPSFYPEQIFYLNTPEHILKQRRKDRIAAAPADVVPVLTGLIFDEPEYNIHFRHYFDQTFGVSEQFCVLDGADTIEALVECVRTRLNI